jgi:hypothetical protein
MKDAINTHMHIVIVSPSEDLFENTISCFNSSSTMQVVYNAPSGDFIFKVKIPIRGDSTKMYCKGQRLFHNFSCALNIYIYVFITYTKDGTS